MKAQKDMDIHVSNKFALQSLQAMRIRKHKTMQSGHILPHFVMQPGHIWHYKIGTKLFCRSFWSQKETVFIAWLV
jgi:hypothetical protein